MPETDIETETETAAIPVLPPAGSLPAGHYPLFATCGRGLMNLVAAELGRAGVTGLVESGGGVHGHGPLETLLRACLWSRVASRILLPLARWPLDEAADGPAALYAQALEFPWHDLFARDATFMVEVAGHSPELPHSRYAALRLKDAVVDHFRARFGVRPEVDTERPEITLHLHAERGAATASLDLSGGSLHRRGWRREATEAPLRETLAAALLLRAGWPTGPGTVPTEAVDGPGPAPGALVDPFCGSGTLVIEAATMALDLAPGRLRPRWGFAAWFEHQPRLWRQLTEEAAERATRAAALPPPLLLGRDTDPRALAVARDNATRAGVAGVVRFEAGDATATPPPPGAASGLLVANPPYGERLLPGEEDALVRLYSLWGERLVTDWTGWRMGLVTARPDLARRTGVRADRTWTVFNGPLECRLLRFPPLTAPLRGRGAGESEGGRDPGDEAAPEEATAFVNRLRKVHRHLGRWAAREEVTAYRLYDADLPEYAVAVDLYQTHDDGLHAVLAEYAAPKTVTPAAAEKRLREALGGTRAVLGLAPDRLHYRLRHTQDHSAGGKHYGRAGHGGGAWHWVVEHGVPLLVNFDTYLDTGLFLDHRPLRRQLGERARGKRFLNLFCYTGAATAHAVAGGAARTVSVDLSNTYLDWLMDSLAAQDVAVLPHDGRTFLPPETQARHLAVRADVTHWLALAAEQGLAFELIFCDPPTFSHSSRMEGSFDVQRDQVALIRAAMRLLVPGGVMHFSCNRARFTLAAELAQDFHVEDTTRATLGEDFRRPGAPPHRSWRLTHRAGPA